MNKEFENLHDKEDIQSENDFLKMKMMLERGAVMGGAGDLDPRLENLFLKNVMAFEEQFEQHRQIRVYDKIERPTIFKPVAEIAAGEIDAELDSLLTWLSEYGIKVSVFSPNVSQHEFYRFITEELFEYEMDDIDLPGWITGFCYDEFHPDPVYENSTAAQDECIIPIFSKKPFDSFCHFQRDQIRFNEHYPLTEDEVKILVNNFKAAYDDIECTEISEIKCEVKQNTSIVTGNYSILLYYGSTKQSLNGKWQVDFETDDDYFWYITNIRIEGISF